MGVINRIITSARYQTKGIFNVDITIYNAQITAISETVLSILGLLGIIIDPITKGTSDSEKALNYDKPKGDK
ncbi:phage holin [Lysinibacillus fusiformis]|uniref:phage holin n=1 Tax=Lysinibacillus fusiformis TaxID=28031 RepID=UPI0036E21B48